MMNTSIENLIGKPVIYNDYLGIQHAGSICFVEYGNNIDDDGNNLAWIYIIDEDSEYNVHQLSYNDNGVLKTLNYAEIRLSSDVFLDEGD